MRSYSINLAGRVKNFSLPKKRPLVPLYEAIVNSLHSIAERKSEDNSFKDGKIVVEIIRHAQMTLSKNSDLLPIVGFKVSDNGIGFTERNIQSFFESDSTYKENIGGKGVGRFSWLKAFSSVQISSVFKNDNRFFKREFVFSLKNLNVDDTCIECANSNDCLTCVTLNTYLPDYEKNMPKGISTVAIRIVQHCLVYFLDDDCPQIIISDENESINLNYLFKNKFKTDDAALSFSINNVGFNLLNTRIEEPTFPGNKLYLCANNRLVDSRNLEKRIVDLDAQLFEKNKFWYVGVLTSEYLDKHVDMNRLSFNIAADNANDNANDNTNHEEALSDEISLYETSPEEISSKEISLEDIVNSSCTYIEEYLAKFLNPIAQEKLDRIEKYVTTDAPQFRHLLKHMPERISNIKPKLSNDKLDDELYAIKREFDRKVKEEQQELFKQLDRADAISDKYEHFLQSQIEKISDVNSAVLAEYVAHRRVIIELFERGLRRKKDGKFNIEKYMHNLIYPMKCTADEIDYEAHNLWLIDEKLSYCRFISSDIPFDNDYKQERTDILILDNPVVVSDDKNDGTIFDTIIIFELKRPMREDYTDSDNPITQLYGYVRKLRNGEATDKYHRPIRVNSSTKYYLYAICDVTSKMERFIEQYSFTPTPDTLGYYNFNKTYNAYFEVLSYDKILYDAKKRNGILFNKLGI